MERGTTSQLELFDSLRDSGGPRFRPARRQFFNFLHGYEKNILLFISFLVVGLLSFSLGVERGKRLALAVPGGSAPAAEPRQAVLTPAPQATGDILIAKRPVLLQATPVLQATTGRFTVQLASYKTRIAAEKEAGLLKKKGFSPFVLAKGNYTVLCVGNFNNREEARSFFLAQIKKQTRFQDYLIRRLT